MTKYLIWTQGFKAPTPELIYDWDNEYKDRSKVLQKQELLPEYNGMTLTQLALIFPYKGEVDGKETKK